MNDALPRPSILSLVITVTLQCNDNNRSYLEDASSFFSPAAGGQAQE